MRWKREEIRDEEKMESIKKELGEGGVNNGFG